MQDPPGHAAHCADNGTLRNISVRQTPPDHKGTTQRTEAAHILEPFPAPNLTEVRFAVVRVRIDRGKVALAVREVVLEPVRLLVRLVAPVLRAAERLEADLVRVP
jgi:hypothetical protein